MSTCLALPYILGIDVISFSITMSLFFFLSHFSTKKKIREEDAEFLFFSFDNFSDIACVFD
jgi:hypothetical protein